MAWRRPDISDLTARLSAREQEAFSRSSGYSPDVLDGVLSQAAEFARCAVRTGGRASVSPEPGSIPDGLMRPVLSIAAIDLLNRMGIEPGEARREAARSAEEFLAKVASGDIVPEHFDGDGAREPTAPQPEADDGPRRTLGGPIW